MQLEVGDMIKLKYPDEIHARYNIGTDAWEYDPGLCDSMEEALIDGLTGRISEVRPTGNVRITFDKDDWVSGYYWHPEWFRKIDGYSGGSQ